MSNADASLHIYQRTVGGDHNDSLSAIARLIEPGQTFLDLGMGTGGLGQYLSQHQAIVADGVTLNPAEAKIARKWYRQTEVADLDRVDLQALFAGNRYDCIVCADVLEHLKEPQSLLAQCKMLLKPGGRLLTSVPNARYCGLVAELVQGDFRYRSEGLLDSTHLRFFTRKSLQRFFDENGWVTRSVTTINRSLLESEFHVPFDGLPPAVARHLLAAPDALTYQFVSVLQPAGALEPSAAGVPVSDNAETPPVAQALFSAQLYLATHGQYSEAVKLVEPGCIGDPQQLLAFDIPAGAAPYTQVRFDPADRPGFFRIHYLQLRLPNGQLAWQWRAGTDSLTVLTSAPHHQILMSSPWETSDGALLLLHGDDPWLEMPFAPELLATIGQAGARFEACVGWPMSGDYLHASTEINAIQSENEQASKALRQEIQRMSQTHAGLKTARLALQRQCDILSGTVREGQKALVHAAQVAQSERVQLLGELRSTQRERNALLDQFNQIALYLQSIEQSTLFRVTRPLVQTKMRLDRLLGRAPQKNFMPQSTPRTMPVPTPCHPVDIIVPVYRGLDDTQRCLESVLSAHCKTDWRLIVINDCSPEPEVTDWLRAFAKRDSRIELLENLENLGFVGTVNRGMAMSADNDVLLLNSDAEVANDWLDRIQRAACSAPRVASVTPFSNNATICSYPRFCQANELPVGYDTASLDRLFAEHLAGQTVEVPTGVGFCMYIRRQCLKEIGLFDVENFGKGYGEENDFCVRAQQAGWTNLHVLDTFVRHAGGISFGDTKSTRELQAMVTLQRLHPRYDSDVQTYVQSDPAGPARLVIDIARITASGLPVILNVMHNREGGTLRHVQELAQQLGGQATFLRLSPVSGGVELRLEGVHEAFVLHFALPHGHARLLQTLRQLQVGHIHFHHLLGHASDICELPAQLGVTHDFTAHDYYSYCPQISLTNHNDEYCGEEGIEQCRQCLQRNPAPGGESIDSWRARHARLLSQSRFLIAPSLDVAQRLQGFVPTARIRVVPHSSLDHHPVSTPKPSPRILGREQVLKIVVLGALSKIKGADVLEEVAALAARQNIPVEFHLLGYAYRSLRTQPKARLTVHGSYEEKDLPQLLQWLQPDAVWFPAVWPETYSYTLSASLESGLPIIAPNMGAFSERLQGRDWTWVGDWQQSGSQWLAFFEHIRQQHFCSGKGPGPISPLADSWRLQDGEPLTYQESYRQSLPLPVAPDSNQLLELQQQIAPNLKVPGLAIKSMALRTLMRLRASRALSPLVRLVPMHLQSRVKSWLGK